MRCAYCALRATAAALLQAAPEGAAAAGLSGIDRDALDTLPRLVGFGQGDGQDPVFERRLGLVLLHVVQRYLTLERAIIALAEVPALAIVLGLLLAAERQDAVGDFDLDVLLRHAGQLSRDGQHLAGIADFQSRPAESSLHERSHAAAAEAPKDVIEQPVHLTVQCQEGIEAVAGSCELLVPRPRNEITNSHGFSPSVAGRSAAARSRSRALSLDGRDRAATQPFSARSAKVHRFRSECASASSPLEPREPVR